MSKADDIRAAATSAAPDSAPATKAAEESAAQVAVLQDQLAQAMQLIAQLTAPPTTPEPVAPVAKRYFSSTPFCNVHVMVGPGNCEAVTFVNGCLETSDPVVQSHLDRVADRPGSTIFSHSPGFFDEEAAAMRADVFRAAATAHSKAVAAGLSTA